jgi:hypothetical protein
MGSSPAGTAQQIHDHDTVLQKNDGRCDSRRQKRRTGADSLTKGNALGTFCSFMTRLGQTAAVLATVRGCPCPVAGRSLRPSMAFAHSMLTALRHPACAGQQRRLSGHGQPLTDASMRPQRQRPEVAKRLAEDGHPPVERQDAGVSREVRKRRFPCGRERHFDRVVPAGGSPAPIRPAAPACRGTARSR